MPGPFVAIASSRIGAKWLRLLGVVVAGLILSGCRGNIDLTIDVREDGSGVVALQVTADQEAADQILDLSSEAGLPLIDLNQAGWVIEPPAVNDEGVTSIGASKEFGNPEQLIEVLAEISGDEGLFSDFELTRTKSFAKVTYELVGEITPAGFEPFSDPELRAALDRTLASFASAGGESAADVGVSVQVMLPGSLDGDVSASGSPLPGNDETTRRWTTTLDAQSSTPVMMGSATRAVAPLVWRGIAIVAGVLGLLVVFGHLLRMLRPTGRRPKTKRAPLPPAKGPAKDSGKDSGRDSEELGVPGSHPEDPSEAQPEDDEPSVIVLDGMGVLYSQGQDVAEVLIPFAREMGSDATSDEIIARARALSLGRITPADFWSVIGVDGDVNELDDAYLSRHQLNPGVVKFLRDLREREVQVACITNECAAWANKLKAKHSLEGLIDPWVISGTVGVRKPDWPIYEVLRRITGHPPAAILVVDDDCDNLDAARSYGFRTAWFAPEGKTEDARGHSILRSFGVGVSPASPASVTGVA